VNIGKDTPPEERAEIMQAFERELLRVPEAFLAHAYANSIVTLSEACRKELARRALAAAMGRAIPRCVLKDYPSAPAAPAPSPEGSLDAMFDSAEDDPV
jgi:hypothetical protein